MTTRTSDRNIAAPAPTLHPTPFTTTWPTRFRPCRIALSLVGCGRVGKALLAQLVESRERLFASRGIDLRIVSVATSRSMSLAEPGTTLDMDGLHGQAQHTDLQLLVGHLSGMDGHPVIVDCTASDIVADLYAGWLDAGIQVVAANKHAGSGCLNRWGRICLAGQHATYRHETTVCAGLPVLQTVRDLTETGDRLHRLEGMFSGSMGWLCATFDDTTPFSRLVSEARALGYTEPDPREDLSGLDVARKLVILARASGRDLTMDQVEIESLLSRNDTDMTADAFMSDMGEIDAMMSARYRAARSRNRILRHAGKIDEHGRAHVGIVELPDTHPFAHVRHTDNVVQMTTDRYDVTPLLVQGPGAGIEVTAGGVFSDILRIADSIR